jgi:hypothetical protein
MIKKKFAFLLFILSATIASYTFMGGDCSTNNDENINLPINTVAPPASFIFKLEAEPGGDSEAIFNWTASPDENNSDFEGYRIITVRLNEDDEIVSVVQVQALGKTSKSHRISVERGIRYKTFLLAELNDGAGSDSLETNVYGGIFYSNDGQVDSYMENSSSESGFGWNVTTGSGTQYPYTDGNAGKIDLHIRELGDEPYFFSPNGLNENYKLTRIKNIGSGQSAFDETDLPEADETFLIVNLGDVYLVKTQEEYYAKIWIKNITPPDDNQSYYTVQFEYKLQPIRGLRVL